MRDTELKQTPPRLKAWDNVTRLIHAAEEGCLSCATELVEQHGVSPDEPGMGFWKVTPRDAAKNGLAAGRETCRDIRRLFGCGETYIEV